MARQQAFVSALMARSKLITLPNGGDGARKALPGARRSVVASGGSRVPVHRHI